MTSRQGAPQQKTRFCQHARPRRDSTVKWTMLHVLRHHLGHRALALRSVVVAVALVAVAQAADAKTFAWKVTGKSGVVYLVGSVHVLSADFYPLNAALD